MNKKYLYTFFIIFFIVGISLSSNDAFIEGKSKPTIKMKAKPSCYSCYKKPYKWYGNTFYNYCPHCKKYNVLLKNPKGVYEKEYTCKKCGADYCGVCGHDKHGNYKRHIKYKLIKV